jgi:hypothetical protein
MARALTDIRSLARQHTESAIRTLAAVMAQSENDNARVNAACQLLDRGWGRAAQVHTDADGGPIQVIIRQVIDITGQSEPVVIEHQPKRDR